MHECSRISSNFPGRSILLQKYVENRRARSFGPEFQVYFQVLASLKGVLLCRRCFTVQTSEWKETKISRGRSARTAQGLHNHVISLTGSLSLNSNSRGGIILLSPEMCLHTPFARAASGILFAIPQPNAADYTCYGCVLGATSVLLAKTRLHTPLSSCLLFVCLLIIESKQNSEN